MKLISMTSYLSELGVKLHKGEINHQEFSHLAILYVHFIQMDLELGFFIPCDLDGNVLEEPKFYEKHTTTGSEERLKQYEQAKKRVLFKGFEYKKTNESRTIILSFKDRNTCIGFTDGVGFSGLGMRLCKNIEDLINYQFYKDYEGLELTQSAISKIKT